MKKLTKIAIFCFIMLFLFNICPIYANKIFVAGLEKEELSISAKAAYLIDAKTGTVVYSKNENQRLPIASMTKLCTLAVIFQHLNDGSVKQTDMVTVSQNAADTEGSSAFLDAASQYSVADLIKTIVMVSANDSCVAMAEHLCGSEDLFVKQMNKIVKTLNLQNTNFTNSTGLPDENHFSSAKDIAKIYQTVCENSLYKQYSKIWMEDFIHPSGRKTGLVNTNRLIKTYDGCDSGKTGHTKEAQYCLTASATRAGTRLISVIIGAPDSKTRFAQTQQMFNYGFANFETKTIVDSSVAQAEISIKGATTKSLQAFIKEDYVTFSKKGEQSNLKAHVITNELTAPVKEGDVVGKLLILDQNNIVMDELDLVSNQTVEKIKFNQILDNIFNHW